MMEFIKVIVVVGVVLGIIMGLERLCLVLARKLNINRKVMINAGIVVLLIAAGISGILIFADRLQE